MSQNLYIYVMFSCSGVQNCLSVIFIFFLWAAFALSDSHLKEPTNQSFVFVHCSKMFDIELCPLPFSLEEMFGFISCRFTGYPSSVQEQALLWLHVSADISLLKSSYGSTFQCVDQTQFPDSIDCVHQQNFNIY